MKISHISLVILLFIVGCNKDSNKEFQGFTTDYLENKELFNCLTCFSVTNIQARCGFAIRDDKTYKEYADSMRIHPLNSNCDTATLKNIDFNKYTLIGIMTEHSACDLITKDISIDKENERVNYNINIKENNGPCNDMLYIPLNLVLISKIPDNYNVEFKIRRH